MSRSLSGAAVPRAHELTSTTASTSERIENSTTASAAWPWSSVGKTTGVELGDVIGELASGSSRRRACARVEIAVGGDGWPPSLGRSSPAAARPGRTTIALNSTSSPDAGAIRDDRVAHRPRRTETADAPPGPGLAPAERNGRHPGQEDRPSEHRRADDRDRPALLLEGCGRRRPARPWNAPTTCWL